MFYFYFKSILKHILKLKLFFLYFHIFLFIKCMHNFVYKHLTNAIKRDFRDFFTLNENAFSKLIKCMHNF